MIFLNLLLERQKAIRRAELNDERNNLYAADPQHAQENPRLQELAREFELLGPGPVGIKAFEKELISLNSKAKRKAPGVKRKLASFKKKSIVLRK